MNEKRRARAVRSIGTAEEVLERLRMAMEVTNDSQLSKKLGISQTTISTWRTRGVVPYEACAKASVETGTSMDVLLFGVALPIHQEASPVYKPLFDVCFQVASVIKSGETRAAVDLTVEMYNDRVSLLSDLRGSLSIATLTRSMETSDRAALAALQAKPRP